MFENMSLILRGQCPIFLQSILRCCFLDRILGCMGSTWFYLSTDVLLSSYALLFVFLFDFIETV